MPRSAEKISGRNLDCYENDSELLVYTVYIVHTELKEVMLYFDLRPGQKCHSKVMHRKEVTHSNGSYERKSRGRKLADEMGRGKKIPMVHS